MPTHASASAVTDAVAKILREKIRLVCAHTGDRCEHCDELLGSTWKVKDGNIDECAKLIAEAIPLHEHPTDRCTICGFAVDLRFEAITPTVDLSPGATKRNRRVGLSQDGAEKMIADFEDAVLDCERNDSTVIRRNELDATRAILRDALTTLAAAPPAPVQEEWPCTMARDLLGALKEIIKNDDDAKNAHGKPDANLNGLGLVDLFDCVGHLFGSGEHRQQPYRSVNLEVALTEARAVVAKVESALIAEKDAKQ